MQASKSSSNTPRANLGPFGPNLHFEPDESPPQFANKQIIYYNNLNNLKRTNNNNFIKLFNIFV